MWLVWYIWSVSVFIARRLLCELTLNLNGSCWFVKVQSEKNGYKLEKRVVMYNRLIIWYNINSSYYIFPVVLLRRRIQIALNWNCVMRWWLILLPVNSTLRVPKHIIDHRLSRTRTELFIPREIGSLFVPTVVICFCSSIVTLPGQTYCSVTISLLPADSRAVRVRHSETLKR